MMGARRKISESRLLTGSYGEYSSKSLPEQRKDYCQQYELEMVWVNMCICGVGGCYLLYHFNNYPG